ncbi:glycosyltransferase [Comamonas odontotermitis]|uniref:glycosyltransferase n=1 Tax=Comamonas odontotermitis TaxID=379895 RepID=UPI0037529B3C
MRIIIDLQAAQASNANRGIGRYALALAKGMARNRGEHDIFIVLSAAFPESIAHLRNTFEDILPVENICVWHPIGSPNFMDPANTWSRKGSEILREAFLANLKPDVVLVSSLFEGPGDDAVTSLGLFDKQTFVATVLYDLIPHIYPDIYLQSDVIAAWYNQKLMHLKRANIQLAISESSRSESIQYLATPPEHVVNISAAIDASFEPIAVDHETQQALQKRLGLKGRFVLYTGGIDHRKNIEGLIRAFALLPAEDRRQLQLAIVCSISDDNRSRLGNLVHQSGLHADAVVFTGFVSDEDLLVLYNLCELFVFPSWHEGFGLPALEAMACGKAVIASNCSSLPEVVGRADALFDPHDDQAIADKIALVLNDHGFRSELEHHGLMQARKFSWDASALAALKAIADQWSKLRPKSEGLALTQPRPKLAYVSPLPPERSGISDYSAELLPALAQYYDIDVVVEQDSISTPWINQHCTPRNANWLREHAGEYERVLYHFGNSHFHQHMFDLIEEVPGVIVLHDFFLSGIISYLTRSGQAPFAWDDALYESHGYKALAERHAPEVNWADIVGKYPCNLPVLQSAYGVIVHSEHSRQLADAWYGESASQNWAVIPLLRTPPKTLSTDTRQTVRAQLGYRDDQFIVCSFGFIASTKLSHKIVEAWLNSPLAQDDRCVLVFVGATDNSEYSNAFLSQIKRSKAKAQIVITGWASNELFHNYLTIADVGVQLRTHSRGETSAAVLDCMNYGLTTIVNAHGSMADLPKDAVWMLDDNFENQQLTEALKTLFDSEVKRTVLGKRAMDILHNKHDPGKCAMEYHRIIESFYAKQKLGIQPILKAIAQMDGDFIPTKLAASAIDKSMASCLDLPQILLDVTELIEDQKKSSDIGHETLIATLVAGDFKCRIEPIYLKDQTFHYARNFTLQEMNLNFVSLPDHPINIRAGDHYIGKSSNRKQVAIREIKNTGAAVDFIENLWLVDTSLQITNLLRNLDKDKDRSLKTN